MTRGGIFGDDDLGSLGQASSPAEAPLIHAEEKRTVFTCDYSGCKEFRLAIDGVPAGGSVSEGPWLVVGEKQFCPEHRAQRIGEGDLGRKIIENFYDGRVPPPLKPAVIPPEPLAPPEPRERDWLGYIMIGFLVVVIAIVIAVLSK